MDKTIGCNSLRGGKQIYGHKTLTSNWIEESFKPGLATSGFSTTQFVTTSQEQQNGWKGTQVVAPVYGAGVVPPDTSSCNYANVIFYDKSATSKTWKPVSKDWSEFGTTFSLRGGLPEDELRKYRDEWTRDSKDAIALRFAHR